MAERYTAETLPPDADERVARWLGWMRGAAGRDGYRYWVHPFKARSKRKAPPRYSTDPRAWPEVHKALERGLWREWVYALSRVINVESTDVDLWEFRRVTATAEQRTAALLNMEAQRG